MAGFVRTCSISISAPAVLALALLGASCAKHFQVEGMVLRVDRAQQTILVSHRAIPGYMQAMVMPFRVRQPEELRGLAPGSRVEFQLAVAKKGSFAEKLRRRDTLAEGIVEDGTERIRLPTPLEKIPIGAAVPNFTLTDQLGRPTRLSDFRGKIIAVNFIYTRCPLPDVCPRLSATFASLQREFAARMGKDLMLFSVTIDPQHDTPEVLSNYAKIWRADSSGWRFLTGPIEVIQHIAGQFGMTYWAEEGLLTHTSETGVISRDGRLVALVEGSSYSARQLRDLIATQLEGN